MCAPCSAEEGAAANSSGPGLPPSLAAAFGGDDPLSVQLRSAGSWGWGRGQPPGFEHARVFALPSVEHSRALTLDQSAEQLFLPAEAASAAAREEEAARAADTHRRVLELHTDEQRPSPVASLASLAYARKMISASSAIAGGNAREGGRGEGGGGAGSSRDAIGRQGCASAASTGGGGMATSIGAEDGAVAAEGSPDDDAPSPWGLEEQLSGATRGRADERPWPREERRAQGAQLALDRHPTVVISRGFGSRVVLASTAVHTMAPLNPAKLPGCSLAGLAEATSDWGARDGLAKAFFDAGARSVLWCTWCPVEAAATHLVTEFYAAARGLGGRTPAASQAEALRQAMLAVRDHEGGRWAHPVHWAGFELLGVSEFV